MPLLVDSAAARVRAGNCQTGRVVQHWTLGYMGADLMVRNKPRSAAGAFPASAARKGTTRAAR